MKCIVVVGSSGAGKSTMARALAESLGLTHIELDGLYHLEGWTQRDVESFRSVLSVAMADATEGWAMCGSYQDKIGDLRSAAADTVVWLDYPRWFIIQRLVRRTVRRAVTRETLWNGNKEPWRNFFRWRTDENVIRWSWTHFHETRERYEALSDSDEWGGIVVHRFVTAGEADAWLQHVVGAPSRTL